MRVVSFLTFDWWLLSFVFEIHLLLSLFFSCQVDNHHTTHTIIS
jgi:hypothetical protein